MSIVARADGAWRLIDCKENSGVYVRDAGEWISLCPEIEPEVLPPFELIRTVEFTNTPRVEVDGVFKHPDDGGFNNYVVNASTIATGNASFHFRLRESGFDALGMDYTSQQLQATGGPPGIAANRQTNNYGRCGAVSVTLRSGTLISVYGPSLTQPTATRNTDGNGCATARIDDFANTHSLSKSYDGITLYSAAHSISGTVSVYGVRS